MSDKYFEVFKEPTDHNKWGKQIEFASMMDSIEETKRTELVSALDFLEKELGKGFLKISSVNHPVKQKISNKADWQTQELIQFVATLHTLKATDSNYPKLIQKLLALDKSKLEGVPFVEIAESYLKENFQVRFPDETNTVKSSDIEIINPENNDRFFIEVSMMNNSAERDFISDNYYFLHHQFHFVPPVYICTGKQKEKIAREDYSAIQQIISEAKKKVDVTNEIVSYSDERFDFSLAPFDKVDELDKICEQKGTRRNDVSGLPINFDETERLVNNKIGNEAKQIPLESNGILYFPVNPLFFKVTDLAKSIIRLQNYILKFPNILGIVLYSKILDVQDEIFVEFEKCIFHRQIFGGVLCRELLFVHNYNCDVKLTDKTIQKIYSVFNKKK
jgi:hypothetical protein